jgi:TRAP-type uncharacterized transport system substrate-binding protein
MKILIFLILMPFLSYAEGHENSFAFYKGHFFYHYYLKQSKVPLDFYQALEGIQAAYEQDQLGLSPEISEDALQEFHKRYYAHIQEEKLAEANRFLKEIASQEGVKNL